jgi:hypothetical protein
MLANQGTTVGLLAAALLAALACGRTPTTAVVGNDAGAAADDLASGAGGAAGTGGKSSSSGAGGQGGVPDIGTEILDWYASTGGSVGSCQTISALPEDAVPVCTFTGSEGTSYGCDASPAGVLVDSTSFYFLLEWDRSIVRCPIGTSNPRIFEYDSIAGLTDAYSVLSGQMLANGLVRFVCGVHEHAGPGWSYRYTCSTSGIQTVQPDPKSDSIYVDIPTSGSASGVPTYRGRLDARCYDSCAPGSVSFHVLGDEAQTPVWISPVNFSADGLTFWFNDLDGGRIAMRIDKNLEVLAIRR